MKKRMAVVILLVMGLNCLGQTRSTLVEPIRVLRVKDWSSKIFLFKKGFWDLFKDTIIMQVGVEEFERVKRFAATENIPYQLTLFKGLRRIDRNEIQALYLKMNQLVVYKIATITYTKENGFKPHAVLSVPYRENRNWDPVAKWDTVYFVVPDENVLVAE